MNVFILVRTKINTSGLFNYLYIYFLEPKSGRTKKYTQLFWRPQLARRQAQSGPVSAQIRQNALIPCLFHEFCISGHLPLGPD